MNIGMDLDLNTRATTDGMRAGSATRWGPQKHQMEQHILLHGLEGK